MAMMPKQKPGRSKQNYATPKAFLTAVKNYLDIPAFTHDFAAEKQTAVCPSYFSEQDSAFDHEYWDFYIGKTGWGWLNPPFRKIAPWAARCAEMREAASIAFLVPASVGADWFRDYVDGKAYVLFLNGRLCFIDNWRRTINLKTGEYFTSEPLYPKDCILCLYSPQIAPGYAVWNWKS